MSPHGFGRQKTLSERPSGELIPLFTGEVFFDGMGLRPGDSRDAAADLPIMRVWRWSDAQRAGMLSRLIRFDSS